MKSCIKFILVHDLALKQYDGADNLPYKTEIR